MLEGTDKFAMTDLNGAYEIEGVPPTDHKITASAAGFVSKTLVHHISRGKIDEINWVMD